MHSLWCKCGKPRSGIINSARLKAKYDYKCAIKKDPMILNQLMRTKHSIIFSTKIILNSGELGITNTKMPLMQKLVWGTSDPMAIATSFRDYYSSIYVDSAADSNAFAEFNDLFTKLTNSNNKNDAMPHIDVELIEMCVKT